MARSWLQIALIVTFCGTGIAADNAVMEVRTDNLLYRVVSRAETFFTPDKLRQAASEFIAEIRSAHVRVGCLELVSASSTRVLQSSRSREHVDFDEVVRRSKSAAKERFNSARVFVLKGSGTLQARYSSGAIEHTVLNGYPDPLLFRVTGLKLKLLSFAVSHAGLAEMRFAPSDSHQATLYMLSDHLPTKEQSTVIWKQLSELLGLHNLTVNLRGSAWWDTPDYPIIPPFEDPSTIRYESYDNERWTNITSVRKGIIYTVFGGHEASEILIRSGR